MLGSLARGKTQILGLLQGDDVRRTVHAFRSCGVGIEEQGERLIIDGVGLNGLQAPESEIYLGNSGTSMRLLTGIFAGQTFETRLTGDGSLSRRPMKRIVDPLRLMGADISLATGDTPPVVVRPVEQLRPIEWIAPLASAQVQSAILLAGLYATGSTYVLQPRPTRNHTANMLSSFGCVVDQVQTLVMIKGRPDLRGQNVQIPADFSSAAFFIVAGLLIPDSEIVLENVGVNSTRAGLLIALELMGASIRLENRRVVGGEPIADIRVRAGQPLAGIKLPVSLVSLMIDEIPILAIAAAAATGQTVIRGCEELRVKESDRIKTVMEGLVSLGIEVEELADGLIICGGSFSGGQVDSFGDHRIAMAFAVAGAVADSEVAVMNADCVNTSFPGFDVLAQRCGMDIGSAAE